MKSPTVLGVLVTLALLAIAGSLALEDEIGLPQCRGSRDEEPAEYTCLEQVKWGKCNETWVIEGNYCEEACGRCEGRAAVPTSGPLETRARSALEKPPSSACLSGYGPPETALYVKGGLLEEESGIAASRANEGILWLHNDNYDKKHVIAVSVLGPNAGNIVYVLDLEGLPGINRYSDFEDIRYRSSFSSFLSLSLSLTLSLLSLVVAVTPPRSVARCPFQSDRPKAERTWCIWVGDVGNNAEWDKGTFMYVVEEPILGSSIHTSPIDRTPRPPTNPITLRLDYEGYGYFKGPNVEAIAVAPDGSRFWAFRKTTSHGGAGPAAVWESPTLTDRSALEEDDCRMIANSSWSCALADRPYQFLISQKYGQATLVGGQPAFSVRSRDSARMGVSAPLRLQKIGSMPNPLGPKDKRNISGADLSLDGRALLIATYAGKSPPPHRSPYRF